MNVIKRELKLKDSKLKIVKKLNVKKDSVNKDITKHAKGWCFTCYELSKYDEWKNIELENIEYICYQEECCPSTGKLHIQGYLEYKTSTTMNKIKKVLGDNTIHLEIRKGKKNQARDYCLKDESKTKPFVELGNVKSITECKQGKRNDIGDIYNMIKNNCSEDDIKEYDFAAYCKYYKCFKSCINDVKNKLSGTFNNIEVNVLIGNAGLGKTSYIYDKHGAENCYALQKGNNDNLWFDGYHGQDVLIIDDFYGNIKYGTMLNLIDGYKMKLEIKGGVTYSDWKYIYITSNQSPDKWYKQGLTSALKRRINNVYEFIDIGLIKKINKKYDVNKVIRNEPIVWKIIDEDDYEPVKTEPKKLQKSSNNKIKFNNKDLIVLNNVKDWCEKLEKLSGNTIDKSMGPDKGKPCINALQKTNIKRVYKNTNKKCMDCKMKYYISNETSKCGCTWESSSIDESENEDNCSPYESHELIDMD